MVDGYISIQAGNPLPPYRDYFVKSDPSQCVTTSRADGDAFALQGYRVNPVPGGLGVALPQGSDFRVAMTGLDGRQVPPRSAKGGAAFLPTSWPAPGVHVLSVRQGARVHRIKVAVTGG